MTASEFFDFITNNPEGTQFPDAPVIRGDLHLSGKSVTWLPKGLIVTGNLSVGTCWNLRALPANLFVGGSLRMVLTRLRTLPSDMDVRGDIYASNLDLDIPEGFTANAGLYLDGYIDKYYGQRAPLRLPDNLTVNGVLDLRNRIIIKWPQNLIVKGRLVIDSTKFKIGGFTINGLDDEGI